jgi:hypothetical protein
MQTEYHCSELFFNAFDASSAFYESSPSTLKASPWAHYIVLACDDPKVTIARLERIRRAKGYIGRGALIRFEEEVLKPKVYEHEIERISEQRQIDRVVEGILQGMEDDE